MAITSTKIDSHWNYFLSAEADLLELSRFIEFDNVRRMGVRPTQFTIKQPAFHKFRSDYDLFQNLHEC